MGTIAAARRQQPPTPRNTQTTNQHVGSVRSSIHLLRLAGTLVSMGRVSALGRAGYQVQSGGGSRARTPSDGRLLQRSPSATPQHDLNTTTQPHIETPTAPELTRNNPPTNPTAAASKATTRTTPTTRRLRSPQTLDHHPADLQQAAEQDNLRTTTTGTTAATRRQRPPTPGATPAAHTYAWSASL